MTNKSTQWKKAPITVAENINTLAEKHLFTFKRGIFTKRIMEMFFFSFKERDTKKSTSQRENLSPYEEKEMTNSVLYSPGAQSALFFPGNKMRSCVFSVLCFFSENSKTYEEELWTVSDIPLFAMSFQLLQ